MRNGYLVLLAVLVWTSSAHAISLPPSTDIRITFENFDILTQYDTTSVFGAGGTGVLAGAGALDFAPLQAPQPRPDLGDFFGVFRISEITNSTGTVDFYDRFTAPTELTGVFWGTTDTSIAVGGGGANTTTEEQTITGTGMHIAIFEDGTTIYDPEAGTAGFVGGAGDPNYTTVTDGDPIWTFSTVPGFLSTDLANEVFTSFQPLSGGSGFASANGGWLAETATVPVIGTGLDNGQFDGTVAFEFSAESTIFDDWLLISDGSISATTSSGAVPEPVSALLIPMAVAPLVLRRRRA